MAKFYHTVFQAVLLFGADTCVITETINQRIEKTHVSFLDRSHVNRQRGRETGPGGRCLQKKCCREQGHIC